MVKKVQKLVRYSHFNRRKIAALIIIFVIVGLTVAFIRASGTFISRQPENGSLQPGATVVSDPAASQTKAVKFGIPTNTTKATALTVVANDITSHAICIDNAIYNGTSSQTACLQIDPSNSHNARPGYYDTVNKKFTVVYGATWTSITNMQTAISTSQLRCSNGNSFVGLGPFATSAGTAYFGEELEGTTAKFGQLDTANNNCTTTGGGVVRGWDAAPVIACSSAVDTATVFHVSTAAALQSAVSAKPIGSEICIAPGHYQLTTTLTLKASMRLIGDPIQRAVIDAGTIAAGTRSSISSGGASVTIANITAQNTHQPTAGCHNCAYGINGGQSWHLYNVQAIHNDENGYHSTLAGFLIENSDISYNGLDSLTGGSLASSGGVKTTSAGTLKHNVVIGNRGPGLWCDGVSSQVCRGGIWRAVDNYVASNTTRGIYYEIAYNGAFIQNNVVVANNTANLSYGGGISVYGSGVTVTNNILHDNNGHGVYLYNDPRTPPFPYSANDTITNNYMNGDDVTCSPADTFGAGIVCSPNF